MNFDQAFAWSDPMLLNLGVREVRISESIPLNDDALFSRPRLAVSFTVEPQEADNVTLATGEIFRNRFWETKNDRAISGHLVVLPTQSEPQLNEMLYVGAIGAEDDDKETSIAIKVFLAEERVRELCGDAKANIFPERIVVEFPFSTGGESALTYDGLPDGSGKKWNNLTDRSIPILGIQFEYSVNGSGTAANDEQDVIRPPSLIEIERASLEKLTALQATLMNGIQSMRWILTGTVLLAGAVIFFR